MPNYSRESIQKLATVHPLLQIVFVQVLANGFDHKILHGSRGEEEQNRLFVQGRSKVQWPNSNHNPQPGDRWVYAVDAAPYPVRWPDKKNRPATFAKDLGRFYYFTGYVRATAERMEIPIRIGADWDGDFEVNDQTFDDLAHFEIIRDRITPELERWAKTAVEGYWERYGLRGGA